MSTARLLPRISNPVRQPDSPLALPAVEMLDRLDVSALVDVLTRLGALTERARARLALASGPELRSTVPAALGDWLTSQEAAALAKVPVSWVREQARRGTIRAHKLRHYIRFRRDELDEDLCRLAMKDRNE